MEIKGRVFLDDVLIDSWEQERDGGMWVMLEYASKAAQKKFGFLNSKSQMKIEIEDSEGIVSHTLGVRTQWVKIKEETKSFK